MGVQNNKMPHTPTSKDPRLARERAQARRRCTAALAPFLCLPISPCSPSRHQLTGELLSCSAPCRTLCSLWANVCGAPRRLPAGRGDVAAALPLPPPPPLPLPADPRPCLATITQSEKRAKHTRHERVVQLAEGSGRQRFALCVLVVVSVCWCGRGTTPPAVMHFSAFSDSNDVTWSE